MSGSDKRGDNAAFEDYCANWLTVGRKPYKLMITLQKDLTLERTPFMGASTETQVEWIKFLLTKLDDAVTRRDDGATMSLVPMTLLSLFLKGGDVKPAAATCVIMVTPRVCPVLARCLAVTTVKRVVLPVLKAMRCFCGMVVVGMHNVHEWFPPECVAIVTALANGSADGAEAITGVAAEIMKEAALFLAYFRVCTFN